MAATGFPVDQIVNLQPQSSSCFDWTGLTAQPGSPLRIAQSLIFSGLEICRNLNSRHKISKALIVDCNDPAMHRMSRPCLLEIWCLAMENDFIDFFTNLWRKAIKVKRNGNFYSQEHWLCKICFKLKNGILKHS